MGLAALVGVSKTGYARFPCRTACRPVIIFAVGQAFISVLSYHIGCSTLAIGIPFRIDRVHIIQQQMTFTGSAIKAGSSCRSIHNGQRTIHLRSCIGTSDTDTGRACRSIDHLIQGDAIIPTDVHFRSARSFELHSAVHALGGHIAIGIGDLMGPHFQMVLEFHGYIAVVGTVIFYLG